MIGNKQTYTISAKNKKLAIEKITPELEKRGLILIKSSVKRQNKGKALGINGYEYLYQYDVKKIIKKTNKKPLSIDYIVNYGITSRHLFETESFPLLRDAKKFIKDLKSKYAWELIKFDTYNPWNPSESVKTKLDEKII